MKPNTQKREKSFSLHRRLLLIILLCWMLPVVLIGGVIGGTLTSRLNRQIDQVVAESASHSARLCSNRIDSAIASSRAASYDITISEAYEQYLKDGKDHYLYDAVTDFLSRQYRYDEKFTSSVLVFTEEPNKLYTGFSNSNENIRYYKERVHDKALARAETLGTGVDFLTCDDRVYLVRNLVGMRSYEPYAVLVLEINNDIVFDSLTAVVWGEDTSVSINGSAFTLKGEPLDFSIAEYLPKNYNGLEKLEGGSYFYGSDVMRDFELSYLIRVDRSGIMLNLTLYWCLLLALAVLPVLLLLLYSRFLKRNLVEPAGRLSNACAQITEGELGICVKNTVRNRELGGLVEAFNTMSVEIMRREEEDCEKNHGKE